MNHNVTSLCNYSSSFPVWMCSKDNTFDRQTIISKIMYEGFVLDPALRPSSNKLFELFQTFSLNNIVNSKKRKNIDD